MHIPRDQLKALRDLKADNSINIVPADKRKAVVIMDPCNGVNYQPQIIDMLTDTKTYKKITDKSRNPTNRTEKTLTKSFWTKNF